MVEATADDSPRTPRSSGRTCRPRLDDLRPAWRRSRSTSHGPKVIPPPAPTTPRATATARSRSSRSTTSTASTTRRTGADRLASEDQRPGHARLDVQPLPGDVLRAAVPARRRALARHRDAPTGLRARLRRSRKRAVRAPDTCHGHRPQPTCRCTRRDAPAPSGSATAGTSCPAPPTTTATTPTARPSSAPSGRRRRAAEHRLRAVARPARRSTTPPQIADPEIDYDDFDTDKDGVVDFFMMVFTGLGGNGDSPDQRGPALRQHLAALVRPAGLLRRPGHRPDGLRLRRPADGPQAGRSGYTDESRTGDGPPTTRAMRLKVFTCGSVPTTSTRRRRSPRRA